MNTDRWNGSRARYLYATTAGEREAFVGMQIVNTQIIIPVTRARIIVQIIVVRNIRKEKNILFSAHRAGALTEVFYEMGEIVFEDLQLLSKGLPPRLCRKAELETVKSLRSKPVDVN